MGRLIDSKVKSGAKRKQTGEKIRTREGQTERPFWRKSMLNNLRKNSYNDRVIIVVSSNID